MIIQVKQHFVTNQLAEGDDLVLGLWTEFMIHSDLLLLLYPKLLICAQFGPHPSQYLYSGQGQTRLHYAAEHFVSSVTGLSWWCEAWSVDC